MTQTQISVSSSTEPVAINEDDRVHFSIAQMQSTRFAEVKAAFPACQNILSLLQHLHSNCADPTQATYNTLQWLAGVIQDEKPVSTHLVFSDGQATGKSIFTDNVLTPVFGNKVRYSSIGKINLYRPRLHIIDEALGARPRQKMLNAVAELEPAKGYSLPRQAILFHTNQIIEYEPANRRFRMARCSTPLDDGLITQ